MYIASVEASSLRERKKERTRRHIADVAARLFAKHGYEQVAVTDVAREAEVSEQTVYNYFRTKEQLITDREDLVRDRLCELILSRPSAMSPAAAIREFALDSVEGIRRIPKGQWRGELGYLSAISPAVHRLALEMTDRQATAVAAAISATSQVKPEIARIQGMTIADVFRILISGAGKRTQLGQSQAKIADELKPVIQNVIDELDRWFRADDDMRRTG